MPNGPRIPTDGLLMLWDFANPRSYSGTGTTLTDLSLNDRTGTLATGELFTGTGPTFNSNNNGYVTFNGTTDMIHATQLPLFTSDTSFSINVWFRPYYPQPGQYIIYQNAPISGPNNMCNIICRSSTVFFTLRYALGSVYVTYSTNVYPNQWNHVIGTYTANPSHVYGELYCNGVKATNKALNSFDTTTNGYSSFMTLGHSVRYLGNAYEYAYPYKGDLAYFSCHSRAVSDSEAYKMYYSIKSRFIL